MNWKQLTDERRVKPHQTSRNELEDLRRVIARDLTDAGIAELSPDRRFATAYNAALQTAKMVIACAGYRVAGAGHHQTTFEAVELAMGSGAAAQAAYFEVCRRKRNSVDYDMANVPANPTRTNCAKRRKISGSKPKHGLHLIIRNLNRIRAARQALLSATFAFPALS